MPLFSKRQAPHWRRVDAGFTLIELLVVISVIVVLLAILLPSLNRARETAKCVSCASNQRQIGVGILMYANDYSGFLPYGCYISVDGVVTWDDLLCGGGYLGPQQTDAQLYATGTPIDSKVLRCPADWIPVRSDLVSRGWQRRTYVLTSTSGNGPGDGWSPANTQGIVFPQVDATPNPYFRCIRLSEITRPTSTLFGSELPYTNNIQGANGQWFIASPATQLMSPTLWSPGCIAPSEPLHNGKWNYFFGDTHVELLSPTDPNTYGARTGGTYTNPRGIWRRGERN